MMKLPSPIRYATTALTLAALLATVLASPAMAKKKKAQHAELVGIVQGLDEKPVAGAQVRLTAPDGGILLDAETDAEGAFSVTVDKAEGEYLLRLSGDGYAPFETPLELKAGEGYNYTFKLIDDATARKQEAVRAFNEGNDLYRAQDLAAAKAKFLAACEADPDLAPPYLVLTDLYLGEEDWPAAKKTVERYLELEPGDPRALRFAVQVYNALDDREREREALQGLKGTEHAKPLAARIYNQGAAAIQAGDDATATERFQTAAELDPSLPEPLVGLASLQYNTGEYAALAATLEKLEQIAPDNPHLPRLRYLMYDAQADTENAWAAFEVYQAADPEAAAALLYQRADIDFREGRPADARRALERILELAPEHPRAHYTLGLVYASDGDVAKARTHLARFIELAPDDPEVATAKEMLPHLK